MTNEFDAYHENTTIQSIELVSKGFDLPLGRYEAIEVSKFDLDIKDTVIPEANNFLIIKSINVKLVDSNNNKLANIKVIFSFFVKNVSKYIYGDIENYRIDDLFNEWLDNVAIAGLRGVMYSEFRGTYLDNAVLPLIKPQPH